MGLIARCAACGEPVSYTDDGGCVGTDPAYHFKAECLLEAARDADAQLQGAVDDLREVARLLDRSTQIGRGPTEYEWAALALANATLDRLGGCNP